MDREWAALLGGGAFKSPCPTPKQSTLRNSYSHTNDLRLPAGLQGAGHPLDVVVGVDVVGSEACPTVAIITHPSPLLLHFPTPSVLSSIYGQASVKTLGKRGILPSNPLFPQVQEGGGWTLSKRVSLKPAFFIISNSSEFLALCILWFDTYRCGVLRFGKNPVPWRCADSSRAQPVPPPRFGGLFTL